MPNNQPVEKQDTGVVVGGEDAISDYLKRLQSGHLTEAEQRVGVSRKPKLGEPNYGTNVLGKDEYPDENLPND